MRNIWQGLVVVVAASVVGCADRATAPAVLTLEAAQEAVDRTVTAVNWELRDLWTAGGRDVVVWVRLTDETAPRFFLVQQGAGGVGVVAARHREAVVRLLAQLDRDLAQLWALGGRDQIVSAQQEATLPPHYFRLPQARAS